MNREERGSALVMAVFVLALLTGMGVAVLFLSQHESRMGRTSLRAKKAFYLAEAGLEDARLTLFEANAGDDFSDFSDNLAAAAGLTLDFDLAALQPTFDDQGHLTALAGYGDDIPLRGLTALDSDDGRGEYIAFLTNDPLEGRTNKVDLNQRVMITAVGAGGASSMEVVQAIIEPLRILPPLPPAAVTLLGPLPAFFDNGNSNAQSHTGDNCGVSGGVFAPIVGTVSLASRNQVRNDINRPENFSAGDFVGQDTVADLTDLADPIVEAAGHGIIDPAWRDCQQIKALVEQLQHSADYYCNSDTSSCSFPSTGPGSIVFIDGDLSNTPSGSHSGTLVVTGELTYNGNTGWEGVVMAVGEGRILRSGGGGGNPSGGVIVAAIDPTPSGPAADRSDWCTSSPDGFLQSLYDTSGGGNATVQWCTEALDAANAPRTYHVVEFLQR